MGNVADTVLNAVADTSGVYVASHGPVGPYFGTPFASKLTTQGASVWTYTGNDSSFGSWLTLAGATVVFNDDGLCYLDASSGTVTHSIGVDTWGQTAAADSRVYVVNALKVDGPGVFVRAFDANFQQLWDVNDVAQSGQFNPVDAVGGLAVDTGTVFFAGRYSGTPTPAVASGVYAFDGASGATKWSVSTMPAGPPSASGGLLYLAELSGSGQAQLVARRQSDGSVVWMAAPGSGYTGGQPPVIAGGLVMVEDGASVAAYQAASGVVAWTAATITPNATYSTYNPPATSLAAATGSGTLVVAGTSSAGGAQIQRLSLATGMVVATDTVAEAKGPLINPVVVGSRVYVSDETGLLALDFN